MSQNHGRGRTGGQFDEKIVIVRGALTTLVLSFLNSLAVPSQQMTRFFDMGASPKGVIVDRRVFMTRGRFCRLGRNKYLGIGMTVPHRRWRCQCVVSAFRIICVVIPGSPALRFGAPE